MPWWFAFYGLLPSLVRKRLGSQPLKCTVLFIPRNNWLAVLNQCHATPCPRSLTHTLETRSPLHIQGYPRIIPTCFESYPWCSGPLSAPTRDFPAHSWVPSSLDSFCSCTDRRWPSCPIRSGSCLGPSGNSTVSSGSCSVALGTGPAEEISEPSATPTADSKTDQVPLVWRPLE